MYTIREANLADAPQIASLLQSRLEPSLLALSVFGCSGMNKLIEHDIRVLQVDGPSLYCVAIASDPSAIVGCCQIRFAGGGAFLNAIAVSRQSEGTGVARGLLSFAVKDTRFSRVDRIMLDVAHYNHRANDWYRRLGFQPLTQMCWFHSSSTRGRSHGYTTCGYDSAVDENLRGGFGKFTVCIGQESHTVGLLGDRWYRIWNKQSALDSHLDAVLQKLEPHRRRLCYATCDEYRLCFRRKGWIAECTMSRLAVPMQPLIDKLS